MALSKGFHALMAVADAFPWPFRVRNGMETSSWLLEYFLFCSVVGSFK